MVLAHLAGLVALGLYGAIGPGDDFAADFGFFVLIAGAVSLPVFVVALVAVLIFAEWIADHLLAFILGGPLLVCGGWVVLAGSDFVSGIALATGTASAVFAALALIGWPAAGRGWR